MKTTIILLILTIVMYVVTKVIAGTMSHKEELRAYWHGEYPTRAIVSALIFLLLAISTVISLIVTIATW